MVSDVHIFASTLQWFIDSGLCHRRQDTSAARFTDPNLLKALFNPSPKYSSSSGSQSIFVPLQGRPDLVLSNVLTLLAHKLNFCSQVLVVVSPANRKIQYRNKRYEALLSNIMLSDTHDRFLQVREGGAFPGLLHLH